MGRELAETCRILEIAMQPVRTQLAGRGGASALWGISQQRHVQIVAQVRHGLLLPAAAASSLVLRVPPCCLPTLLSIVAGAGSPGGQRKPRESSAAQ